MSTRWRTFSQRISFQRARRICRRRPSGWRSSKSSRRRSNRSMTRALPAVLLIASLPAPSQNPSPPAKTYPLVKWDTILCSAKGRFQDCHHRIIDRIIADGKSAIPILISQITDERWVKGHVTDFWPPIQTGDLAWFILQELFLDDTWTKATM